MSESREHKRRYNLRLEFIAKFGRWLDEEPLMIFFWKWHKWKKRGLFGKISANLKSGLTIHILKRRKF